jgi:hypothetical protein
VIIPHLQEHLFHVGEPQFLFAPPDVFAEEEKPDEPQSQKPQAFSLCGQPGFENLVFLKCSPAPVT